MSVRKEQEELSRMLELADKYLKEGDTKMARRTLICAAAKMMEISESATAPAKDAMAKRAYTIIKESVHISTGLLDDILIDLGNGTFGFDIESEVAPKERTNKVLLDDVVGLDDVKEVVNRQIIYPRRYASIYKRFAKKGGGGILLYGLPGTGKTMIAKAIASEINADFISVKCTDILSKWLGDSEKQIKELFDRARASKLSILFFDEFDALGINRQGAGSAMSQIVPALLAEMNGFEDSNNVIIICATNVPWTIDKAFLRPGRLTNRIYVPLPDKECRVEMFKKKLAKAPIAEDIDFAKLADITDYYSGADIEELCDYAKNYAIDRAIHGDADSIVTMDDIINATTRVKPSIRIEDIDEMDNYNNGFNIKTGRISEPYRERGMQL